MTMSLIAGVAAFVLTVLAMPHFITYYKIKKIDKVLIKNLLTLLSTSVTLKSSITRDNFMLS